MINLFLVYIFSSIFSGHAHAEQQGTDKFLLHFDKYLKIAAITTATAGSVPLLCKALENTKNPNYSNALAAFLVGGFVGQTLWYLGNQADSFNKSKRNTLKNSNPNRHTDSIIAQENLELLQIAKQSLEEKPTQKVLIFYQNKSYLVESSSGNLQSINHPNNLQDFTVQFPPGKFELLNLINQSLPNSINDQLENLTLNNLIDIQKQNNLKQVIEQYIINERKASLTLRLAQSKEIFNLAYKNIFNEFNVNIWQSLKEIINTKISSNNEPKDTDQLFEIQAIAIENEIKRKRYIN